MTQELIERLEPCPFCEQPLELVESLARAFDPPRLYREYHHRPAECIIGKRAWTFPETAEKARQAFIAAWNTRDQSQSARIAEQDALARALVAKLDECEPHITNAFAMEHFRGRPYSGPQYRDELNALRNSLTKDSTSG